MTQQEQEHLFIADYLAKLPSEELLSQAHTNEQQIEWLNLRLSYGLLSVFWKESQSSRHNPLDVIADNKQIDPHICEHYRRWVSYLMALWQFVQIAEPPFRERCLKANLPFNYPFQSSLQMFLAFLEEEAEDEFLPCLQNHYEKSLPKMRDLIKLGKKAHLLKNEKIVLQEQRNSLEINKFKSLEKKHFVKERRWYLLFITFCRIEAKSNRLIKENFDKFMTEFYEFHSHIATSTRKRESAIWQKSYSYAWKKGKKFSAGKGGAYSG
ncbi:hypothetical protein NIES21_54440 [Anabaenopsis circularis NIES-21]|uniref:Uncharacterized protein n=1 Tax=Anabaenopsis circularis NIES-21 TaxID=1085406 RepID=A0A1Z4GPY3_9CYAN|nr:hypothetical protein NIES21_54440 [Anabaenopsis circularis NIES-21]